MAMVLASASGGFKNAKNAKNAKSANPWRLALLALLGRAGDPIVAEAGGYATDCGMESIRSALGGFKTAKTAKAAKTANPRELAVLAVLDSPVAQPPSAVHLRNFSKLCQTC